MEMVLLPRKPGKMSCLTLQSLMRGCLCRMEEGEDVEIMSEKSAEEVTAEQLKKRKLQEEEEDDIVCIE